MSFLTPRNSSTAATEEVSSPQNSIRLYHQILNPGYTNSTTVSPGVLELPLPADIAFGISSSWEAFTEGSLIDFVNRFGPKIPVIGRAAATAFDLATRYTNQNAFIAGLANQTWKGTSPLEFSFRVELSAYRDTQKDVRDKIVALLNLSAPGGSKTYQAVQDMAATLGELTGLDTTLITSPPRDILMHIGSNILLPSVIIPTVNITFETRRDVRGDFLFATADISVRSSRMGTINQMIQFGNFQSAKELDAQDLERSNFFSI